MRKTYTRPVLNIEHFTMTQSIAANCNMPGYNKSWGIPTHDDKYTCAWDDGDDIYWAIDHICETVVADDFELEVGCYNNPNGGVTVFGS